jgi:imidazolonepropionase-like amidohydrolase/predicted negative regulator of RcsB-dependent stress response
MENSSASSGCAASAGRLRIAAGLAAVLLAVPGAASPGRAPTPPSSSSRTTAFVHANVVPMDSDRVLHDQTVVVTAGKIRAIGPSGSTATPRGARRIDCAGGWLTPGLADMHVHVYAPEELTLYAVNGVTTVLNLDGRPTHLKWRARIASGELLGPYLYSAGPMFNRPRTAAEAVAEVDRQSEAGYDAIKIYNQVSAAEYPALTAEAHEKNMVLVGHVAREPGYEATLAAGQSIAHAEELLYTFFNPNKENDVAHPLDASLIPKAVALTKQAGVSVIPTLVAFRNIVRQAEDVRAYLRDPHLDYLAPSMRAQLEPARNTYANRFSPEIVSALGVDYEFQRRLVKALHEGGVPILTGTDASWLGAPGWTLLDEVGILQDLGFTPYEAIRAATADPARFLRHEDDFGTIQPGRRADLILTRGNPLEDARRLGDAEGVMVHGRWIPAAERKSMLAAIPGSYRKTAARIEAELASDPRAAEADLAANDPLGTIASGVLLEAAESRAPKELAAMLRRNREANPESTLTSEETINQLGYTLLAVKKNDAAVEVFRLNTELYPKSGNTFDSLGETLLALGDKDAARQAYARALEVQPDYPNAKAAKELLETTLKK